MKETKKIPLDPSTPQAKQVKQIPMPSLEQEREGIYPESMQDDVYNKTEGKEQTFWNFIEKCKDSKKRWMEKLQEENIKK